MTFKKGQKSLEQRSVKRKATSIRKEMEDRKTSLEQER